MSYNTMTIGNFNKENENIDEYGEQLSMAVTLPKITTTSYINNNNSNEIQLLADNQDKKDQPNNENSTNTNQRNSTNPAPTLEIATYSETDVYECYIKGMEANIVMRRVRDDFVNITQVLKLAKFPKTQRSKILEREVALMKHEKVQGGYGRFQGTWISLNDAKILIGKYRINDIVVTTLINFILDPNNPPNRRTKNSILRRTSPGKRISSPSSYKRTPRKKKNGELLNAATTSASTGNLSANKKKIVTQPDPSPLQNVAFQTPQHYMFNQHTATDTFDIADSVKQNASSNEKSSNSTISRLSSNDTPLATGYSSSQKPLRFYPVPTNVSNINTDNNVSDLANNKKFDNSSLLTKIPEHNNHNNNNTNNNATINPKDSISLKPKTFTHIFKQRNPNSNLKITDTQFVNEKNQEKILLQNTAPASNDNISSNNDRQIQSFQPQNNLSNNTQHIQTLQNPQFTTSNGGNILQQPLTQNVDKYKQLLLDILTTEVDSTGSCDLPDEIYHPPQNFNVNFEIDGQGHTALHWAAAMANMSLIKILLALNANPLYCNEEGFTCVTKAVFYNNNFKSNTFPQLLSLLNVCLVTPDNNGRLPLHYLVELSANTSKNPMVISTYSELILHELSKNGPKIIQMVLNQQDHMGNTVLHLCALNSNIALFNRFYLLGASTEILNLEKKTPLDILSQNTMSLPLQQINTSSTNNEPNSSLIFMSKQMGFNKVNEEININKNDEIINTSQSNNNINNMNDKDIISSTEQSNGNIFQNNKQLLETPRKILSNRYISTNDLQTTTKASNNTINLTSEELSTLDDIVTSSVMKNSKAPPTLSHSPMIQMKVNDNNSAIINTLGNSISNKIQNDNTRIEDIEENNETDKKAIFNMLQSPSPKKISKSRNRQTSKIGDKIAIFSQKLINAINGDMEGLINSVEVNEKNLSAMKNNIDKVNLQYKKVCLQAKVTSAEGLQNNLKQLKETLQTGVNEYSKNMEKSQALKLATFVQIEEENQHIKKEDEENDDTTNDEKLKNAVTLTVLQFKRKMWLKRLSDKLVHYSLNDNIKKYKQLIGMAFENIDTKLDEIEAELQASTF